MFTKFSQFNNGGTLIAGDQVVGVRNGVNTIFSASVLPNLGWSTIATSQTIYGDNGYFVDNSTPITLTLPTTIPFGELIQIVNIGSSTFTIAQNTGQQILIGSLSSTLGTSGSIASNAKGDALTLVCDIANTIFVVWPAPQGIWSVT